MSHSTRLNWPEPPERLINSLKERLASDFSRWRDYQLPEALAWAEDRGIQPVAAMQGGSEAATFKAKHSDHGLIVLKINPSSFRTSVEAETWNLWSGPLTPRLIFSEVSLGILAMKFVDPGETMDGQPPSPSTTHAAAVLAGRLHKNSMRKPTRDVLEVMTSRTQRALRCLENYDRLNESFATRAMTLAAILSDRCASPTALHGDFFPDNILQSANSWVAVDAEPCWGDPAFDAGTWVYGRERGLHADAYAQAFADHEDLELQTVLDWAAVVAASNLAFRLAWSHASENEREVTQAFVESRYAANDI
jgi:hypothetical protein